MPDKLCGAIFFSSFFVIKQVNIYFSSLQNSATLFCCEAPEMFCGRIYNFRSIQPSTSVVEVRMTEFSFLVGLALKVNGSTSVKEEVQPKNWWDLTGLTALNHIVA